jgi:hypothetical protein
MRGNVAALLAKQLHESATVILAAVLARWQIFDDGFDDGPDGQRRGRTCGLALSLLTLYIIRRVVEAKGGGLWNQGARMRRRTAGATSTTADGCKGRCRTDASGTRRADSVAATTTR